METEICNNASKRKITGDDVRNDKKSQKRLKLTKPNGPLPDLSTIKHKSKKLQHRKEIVTNELQIPNKIRSLAIISSNAQSSPYSNVKKMRSSVNEFQTSAMLAKNDNYVMEDSLLNQSKVTMKISAKKQEKLKKIKEMKNQSLPAKHPEAEKRTIFVGNVNAATKKKKLQQFFSQYGSIESTRYRGIAAETMDMSKKEAITQHKLHPDRKTLIAYIRFKDESSKNKALEANGVEFEGLHLRVDNATPKPVKVKNAIFIGNLPFEVEDEDLWKLFESCGDIESVRIIRSSVTGAGKGFGFVNFKFKDSIEMAFQHNGKLIKNRPIRIKRMAKKGKEKISLKRKKSAAASLVNVQKSNKMKLSFMKNDKPHFKFDIKKGKKKDKLKPNLDFTGAKTAEDGKLINKTRKPRKSKHEKRKNALAAIMLAKTGLTK